MIKLKEIKEYKNILALTYKDIYISFFFLQGFYYPC